MSEPPETDPPGEPARDQSATEEELLAELAEDFASRLRRGEKPTVEEYVQEHPALTEKIRKVFPAIGLIEQSRPFDSAATSEQPGDVIGRYKLLERIGEGGFGVVFMAEQEHPIRRRVALKVIKLGMDTKRVIARFEAERQALAVMDHPNIARIFDAGATTGGRPYFVMELVRGTPITRYCDEHQLTPKQRIEFFQLVCQAVQHAHQKGIIHRDLKPSNVLVTVQDDKPVPKVIDFGIAKATQARLTEKTLFTEFRQMIGTPEYMSPEQADVNATDIDTRSDVYSLGVLLYELLTGSTPFAAQDLRSKAYAEIQRIIREVDPPKPSTRLGAIGETIASVAACRHVEPAALGRLVRGELDCIVMKCLEKDRTRRYETANDVAADVQRHLNNEAVVARPQSSIYRFRKMVRRNKLALGAASAVMAAILFGALATTWQATRALRVERERNRLLTAALLDKTNAVAAQAYYQGRPADAIALAESNLTTARASLAPHEDARLNAVDILAWLYVSTGRAAEGAALFEESYAATKTSQHPVESDILIRMENLGVAYREAGRLEDSRRILEETLARRNPSDNLSLSRDGYTVDSYASALCNLGLTLIAQGKFTDAEERLGHAVAIFEREAPNNILAYRTKSALGESLVAQKRFLEAEPLLIEGWRGIEEHLSSMGGNRQKELANAVRRIIKLYADWRKPDQASQWEQRLADLDDKARPATQPLPRGRSAPVTAISE